jgi:putative NIF3 family GTP cyclohydrolase 1 type 2
MKLADLYRFVVEFGMRNDPRGADEIAAVLKREKERFAKLSEKEKKYYDRERLENPYGDTRILYGSGETPVKALMVGIDIEAPELVLADVLRSKGRRVDAVLAHHPEGGAFAALHDVMCVQADVLARHGVPIGVAEAIMEPRIREVSRRVMPANHQRPVDAARLLDIPFMNSHTPSDNCVATHLQRLFDKKRPRTLADVVDLLLEIPEYDHAAHNGGGPVILAGSPSRSAGKVFVDMTGGTEGAVQVFEKLAIAGVSTVVGMHFSEDHFKQAEKQHLNLVVAGHIASDNVGMNIVLDAVEKEFGRLDVIELSGFKRFRRSRS